jgi:tRNA(Arg) A34 adenosine deaminase TadA
MKSRTFNLMRQALEEAKKATCIGEVPVGAVLVINDQVIARTHNRCLIDCDPTAHAEILAIRQAAHYFQRYRLENCDLYVTLEPCAMCAQAIAHARIRRLIFGAYDPKGGGIEHGARVFGHPTCHHVPEIIGGILEKECGDILKAFFQGRR